MMTMMMMIIIIMVVMMMAMMTMTMMMMPTLTLPPQNGRKRIARLALRYGANINHQVRTLV
jgi:hypothetical protein